VAMNGFRSKVRSFFLGHKEGKPIIQTENGPVTESMRLQAALNMRAKPEIKAAVEAQLAREMGSIVKGLMEARRRYREAYEDLDGTY
jgi:hypothetical protein